MKTIVAVLCLVIVSIAGCSIIAPKIGPQVAKGVNRYCGEPYAERLVIRQTVNDQIAPNKITVNCSGDPQ